MINYLEELNEEQRKAVIYNNGPSLIIAGAGSGKTRVLTYKIAKLLEEGYNPRNILALTFTNKAAREMKQRIGDKVGEDTARDLWMGTFHSIFYRILREEAELIGFKKNFTIYDASDSKSLIKSIIKELELDSKKYNASIVQYKISQAKNNLITSEAYSNNNDIRYRDNHQENGKIYIIYNIYTERCKMSNAMDFDDLLLYTYLLFKNNPKVLEKWRNIFQFILVDEYQDTNIAQDKIVHQIAGVHQKLCVVGDDAQSIYSFRGADIRNILKFQNTYDNVKIFKLQQNYRSTKTIVKAANSLIKNNENRIQKEVFSENEEGELIKIVRTYTEKEEAIFVVNKIESMIRYDHEEYKDFAILYRTNAQSRVLEDAFRRIGIPYRVYGGLSFYQRKEIKDVLAYLRLIINNNDEEAFKRIINYPARGIGKTTQDKLLSAAVKTRSSLWDVMSEPDKYDVSLSKGTITKLQAFANTMKEYMEDAKKMDAYELGLKVIMTSGIYEDIKNADNKDETERKENVEELINAMKDFCESRKEENNNNTLLADFLMEVSLMTDIDNEEDNENSITLMTIHSAKGLEFKNVFIVGMEEGLFPSFLSAESSREIEEERRLLYVAITRAEKRCFLSHADSRMRYGKIEYQHPSRFLKEIDEQYISNGKPTTTRREPTETKVVKTTTQTITPPTMGNYKKISSTPKSEIPTSVNNIGNLYVGSMVEHDRFGKGEVIQLMGEGNDAKASIHFQEVGDKVLLLRFARLNIID